MTGNVDPLFVPAKVAARVLHLTLPAFYGCVRQGVIRGYRLGQRRLRFRLDEVEAALKPEPPRTAPPATSSVSKIER